MTSKADHQKLVALRLADARALFYARRYAGSYYLAGYAIECALKVCIANQFRRHEIPDQKFVQKIHTHEIVALLRLAGLEHEKDTEASNNANFGANWDVVKDWKETARYDPSIKKVDARDMLLAINDENDGVLQWLQRHW